eukprot:Clim_evm27s9 gene=Clim_evmTU27s9
MDEIIAAVQYSCADELAKFQQCVEASKDDWNEKCAVQQQNLADCSNRVVKPLLEVRQRCKDKYQAYLTCVENSGKSIDDMNAADQDVFEKVCPKELEAFRTCADGVLKEFEMAREQTK